MSDGTTTRNSSRADAFVDAAFAFCMTLLVVAGGEAPQTLADLQAALMRIPAFAVGFALLALFWWSHYAFRKLYRGDDGPTLLISLVIVFVIMIYVYPLRLLGESTAYYLSVRTLPASELVRSITDMQALYLVYGAGFMILSFLYILLYLRAARRAPEDENRRMGATTAGVWLICALVGGISVTLALVLPTDNPWSSGFPGMAYMLIPVLIWPYIAIAARKPKPAPVAEEPPTAEA